MPWKFGFLLTHGLVLKKMHKIIKFNFKGLAETIIGMNRDLRKKIQKMIMKKIFLSWWIMQFLENYGKCEKT